MRSTAELRQLWAPACSARSRTNIEDAYRALDACFRRWNYKPKAGQTYAYSCRRITGGSGYSLHAYRDDTTFRFWSGVVVTVGIAVDINSVSNPYGSRLVTDMPRPMVEAVLAIRTNSGAQVWRWGGQYSGNKDAMHYELVCSPVELRTGINWKTVQGVPQLPADKPATPQETAVALFKYGKDLDAINVDANGDVVTRFYQPGGAWKALVLAKGGVPFTPVDHVLDYLDTPGRIDAATPHKDGGLIHVWFVPGVGWGSEVLP